MPSVLDSITLEGNIPPQLLRIALFCVSSKRVSISEVS
jgi:hypothetical protein